MIMFIVLVFAVLISLYHEEPLPLEYAIGLFYVAVMEVVVELAILSMAKYLFT